MTPEQLELKALLDVNPIAWLDLTPYQQTLLRNTLRPAGEFTPEQRQLLRDRYLPVSDVQLAQIQSLLPARVGVTAIADVLGGFWLTADLLTDCMMPSDTYHAIAPILATLPITLLSPDDFPTPDAEL